MTPTEDLSTQHAAALADFREARERGDHVAMKAASDRELAIRTAMVRAAHPAMQRRA